MTSSSTLLNNVVHLSTQFKDSCQTFLGQLNAIDTQFNDRNRHEKIENYDKLIDSFEDKKRIINEKKIEVETNANIVKENMNESIAFFEEAVKKLENMIVKTHNTKMSETMVEKAFKIIQDFKIVAETPQQVEVLNQLHSAEAGEGGSKKNGKQNRRKKTNRNRKKKYAKGKSKRHI